MTTRLSEINEDSFYVDDITHTLYANEYFEQHKYYVCLRLKTYLNKSFDVVWRAIEAKSETEARQKALKDFFSGYQYKFLAQCDKEQFNKE
jgi:hypothetical protein